MHSDEELAEVRVAAVETVVRTVVFLSDDSERRNGLRTVMQGALGYSRR
jgi:hypothetical protein